MRTTRKSTEEMVSVRRSLVPVLERPVITPAPPLPQSLTEDDLADRYLADLAGKGLLHDEASGEACRQLRAMVAEERAARADAEQMYVSLFDFVEEHHTHLKNLKTNNKPKSHEPKSHKTPAAKQRANKTKLKATAWMLGTRATAAQKRKKKEKREQEEPIQQQAVSAVEDARGDTKSGSDQSPPVVVKMAWSGGGSGGGESNSDELPRFTP